MRRTVVALCAAGTIAAPAPATAAGALPRTTVDRPDETTGPQVHVVYAMPADGEDRDLDVNGTIATSVGLAQAWLSGQTGGAALRMDTSDGALDVTFLRLALTDAAIAARGAFVREELERTLIAAGLHAPGKVYVVFYDGSSTFACGSGAWPPELPGIAVSLHLKAVQNGVFCGAVPFAAVGGPPGYWEFAFLHEILHQQGFVATCAPHHTQRGHSSDHPTDLMYAGPEGWRPSVLDLGRDDYYRHGRAGCPDFADSPLLGRAAAPKPPSGLRVVREDEREIEIDWADSPDLRPGDAYQVSIDDRAVSLSVPDSAYVATGLTPGRSYQFRVSAGQAGSFGDWTAAVVGVPRAVPIATPTATPTTGPVASPTPTATPAGTPSPASTPAPTPAASPAHTPAATPAARAAPAPTPVATATPQPPGKRPTTIRITAAGLHRGHVVARGSITREATGRVLVRFTARAGRSRRTVIRAAAIRRGSWRVILRLPRVLRGVGRGLLVVEYAATPTHQARTVRRTLANDR